jgi:hypothetical protein
MAQFVKIPVADVVFVAFRSVFGRIGLVLELGWLPLLIILAALLLPDLALRYVVEGGLVSASTDFDIGDLIQETVVALCLSAFALRWYQLMLLPDPNAVSRRAFFGALLRFLAYTAGIGAVIAALTAAIAYGVAAFSDDDARTIAAQTLAAAVAMAVSLAVARLSLLFPAAAYGAPLGLGAAWRAMRGNSWRLVGASLMAALPILLFHQLLVATLAAAQLLHPDQAASDSPVGLILLGGVVVAVLGLILSALGASVLSEFYRRIMRVETKGG